MEELISVSETNETGRIFYHVIGKEIFGIKIEQERGILKTAEVKNITKNYEKIKEFAKILANGNVTSVMLYGMCDDFYDAENCHE